MQHTGTGLVTTCHYKHNLFDYTVLQHIRSKYWKKYDGSWVSTQWPMTHVTHRIMATHVTQWPIDPWPTDPSPTLLDSMFYWCQLVRKELSEWYSKLVSVLAIIPVPTLTRVQLTWIVSLLIQLLMHKGTTCFTQHLTVTRINFRFRLLVTWSSPRRRDASSYIIWCKISLSSPKLLTFFRNSRWRPPPSSTHTINFRSATSIPSLKTAPGPLSRCLMSSKELPAGRIASFLYGVAQWKTNRSCTWSIERRHF